MSSCEIGAKAHDFTELGLRQEGMFENDRNADNTKLFRDIIREVYGADQSIIAHHLTYVTVERRNGSDYQIVQEIPSCDTLIFDTDAARKIWGEDRWKSVVQRLAIEPICTRDKVLAELYYAREKVK